MKPPASPDQPAPSGPEEWARAQRERHAENPTLCGQWCGWCANGGKPYPYGGIFAGIFGPSEKT